MRSEKNHSENSAKWKESVPLWGLLLFVTVSVFAVGSLSCSVEPRASGEVNPNISFKGLSSEVDSVTVTVTGPGISQQESFSPSTERIVIPLPEAENVLFDVEAAKSSVGAGAVISYGEAKYADLVMGETLDLDFVMGPYETKILVPDQYGKSDSVVQLKDLQGSELEADVGDFETYVFDGTYSPSSNPWDIEIDNQGRIWIATYSGIDRIDDISGINFVNYPAGTGNTVYSLAIDRANGYVYFFYWDGNSLLGRRSVSPSSVGPLEVFDPLNEEAAISGAALGRFGIEVDRNGYVYFTAEVSGTGTLYKYDPNKSAGNRIVDSYSNHLQFGGDDYYNPDIVYKAGYLYVSNNDGADGYKILKFDTDLNLLDHFGVFTSDPLQIGGFFGPSRFLATTSKKIFIIDDSSSYEDSNRIVGFSNLDGDDWETYMPKDETPSGYDIFHFYC